MRGAFPASETSPDPDIPPPQAAGIWPGYRTLPAIERGSNPVGVVRSDELAHRLLCVVIITCLLTGCATNLTPPCPAEDRAVYLIDYGTHSTLVLPVSSERYMEYAYADWEYAVEENRGIWGSIQAIAWPSRGALGRRYWNAPLSSRSLTRRTRAQMVHRLKVDPSSLRRLVEELDRRFERSARQGPTKQALGMTYVHDAQSYTLSHTCNTEVIQWLERLDVQAEGPRFWSEYRVRNPEPAVGESSSCSNQPEEVKN